MKYPVAIGNRALKALEKIPDKFVLKIAEKIDQLADQPRTITSAKIKSKSGIGFRIRVGDYRILYDVDNDSKIVIVLDIKKRDQAYKCR